MSHVDTYDKIIRLASMAYYCDAKHIRMAQIACVIASIEKGESLTKEQFTMSIESAEQMIYKCKETIRYAKRQINKL